MKKVNEDKSKKLYTDGTPFMKVMVSTSLQNLQ